jgi:hypothetical protein
MRDSDLIYEEKGCHSCHIMRKLFPSHMTVSVHCAPVPHLLIFVSVSSGTPPVGHVICARV